MADIVVKMKYVMYPGEQFMFVPLFVSHDRLARNGAIRAGFVTLFEYPEGTVCVECEVDNSESLKLQSRPQEDSEIITRGLAKKWGD